MNFCLFSAQIAAFRKTRYDWYRQYFSAADDHWASSKNKSYFHNQSYFSELKRQHYLGNNSGSGEYSDFPEYDCNRGFRRAKTGEGTDVEGLFAFLSAVGKL